MYKKQKDTSYIRKIVRGIRLRHGPDPASARSGSGSGTVRIRLRHGPDPAPAPESTFSHTLQARSQSPSQSREQHLPSTYYKTYIVLFGFTYL